MAFPALTVRLTDGMARRADDPGSIEDLAELLLRRPSWQADALCRESPRVRFFPALGESGAAAKAICSRCLVREECLDYALALETPPEGIWGGLSKQERAKLRRAAA